MAMTLVEIEALIRARGGEQYAGEPVTQLEHALQSAWLAEQEGADDGLVTAALLHDLGGHRAAQLRSGREEAPQHGRGPCIMHARE